MRGIDIIQDVEDFILFPIVLLSSIVNDEVFLRV